jgi:5-methyltetrahydrofolate--homocysteine methyltransferase
LLKLIEEVLFNRNPNGTELLLEYAQRNKSTGQGTAKASEEWRKLSLDERICHALVQGVVTYIVEDTEEARKTVCHHQLASTHCDR